MTRLNSFDSRIKPFGTTSFCNVLWAIWIYLGMSLLFIYSAQTQGSEGQESEGQKSLSYAQVLTLSSKVFNGNRELFVSVPASYGETQHTYPVLVLLDANDNMQHAVASARLLANWRGIPELIIVGINSDNRFFDFTHSKEPGNAGGSGGAPQFTNFIVNEVMPFVEERFRTHPFTILLGHSLSGLYTANELLLNTATFDAHILIAPSLWWNDLDTIGLAKSLTGQKQIRGRAVFFGIGEDDGDSMKNELNQFVRHFSANGSAENRIVHKLYDGEDHMSVTLRATYDGLLHVFADTVYTQQQWPDFTTDSFLSRERVLEQKYGASALLSARNYAALANYLLEQAKYKSAIAVLNRNAQVHAGEPRNFELLGNAYILAGNADAAKQAFLQAYEMANQSTSYDQQQAKVFLEEVKLLENPIDHTSEELNGFSGCFTVSGTKFETTLDNGQLMVSISDATAKKLFATGTRKFKLRVAPSFHFEFKSAAGGNMTQMKVIAYGNEYLTERLECAS